MTAWGTLYHVERAVREAVHDAPSLARLAALGTIMPAHLAATVRREFHRAVAARYRELTRPGTPDGPV